MLYGALIFDCDGTLADTMPAHYDTWKAVFNLHGIPFSVERFYSLGVVPAKEVVEIVAGEAGVKVDTTAVAEEKDRAFMEQLDRVRPVEAVAEVARKFRGKLPMAVATGSHRELAEKTLELIGMAGWFDTLVCAEDVVNPKPAPDIFLEAARRLGIDPDRCCVYEAATLWRPFPVPLGLPSGGESPLQTPPVFVCTSCSYEQEVHTKFMSYNTDYFFYGAVEGVGTGVMVGVGVAVETGVGVIVGVAITVGVGVAVGARLGVAVGVMLGVGVGVSGR